jgi:hypothetical protein
MDSLRDFGTKHLLGFAEIYGVSLSLFLTILSIAGVLIGSVVAIRWKRPRGSDKDAPLEIQARIDEIEDALKSQKAIAATSGAVNNLLVFLQIVIGGTLASTFLQEHVDRNVTGALGVLVLISSLIHQQFRPDLLRRVARRRVARLGALLRYAEDAVFALESNDKTENIITIRKRVAAELTTIEDPDLPPLPEHNVSKPQSQDVTQDETTGSRSSPPEAASNTPPAGR